MIGGSGDSVDPGSPTWPITVVIAPDSFKGSLTSVEVAQALAAGWHRARPADAVVLSPLADGGEGTLVAIEASGGWSRRSASAHDPLGRPIEAAWLLADDGHRAVVELASASGLSRLGPGELAAGRASTYGTGEVIRAVLDAGVRHIVLGVGGSATTDGAAGILLALGARLLDADGRDLAAAGADGRHLAAAGADGRSQTRPSDHGRTSAASDHTRPAMQADRSHTTPPSDSVDDGIAGGASSPPDALPGVASGAADPSTESGSKQQMPSPRNTPPGGADLARLATADLSDLDPRLAEVELRIACDVTNPLLGPHGAAPTYGPQKGASPEEVATLDAALTRWADVLEQATGRHERSTPGAGAAGGTTFGLACLAGRLRSFEIVPGVDLVMDETGLDERLAAAGLVITGEGRIDAQTAFGKTALGVAQRARAAGVPCIAVGGGVEPEGAAALAALGAIAVPVIEHPMSVAEAMAAGSAPLERCGERLARLISLDAST